MCTVTKPALRLITALIAVVMFSCAAAGELQALNTDRQSVLELPDLNGKQRSLAEFSGDLVLVTFWASWCTPCIREMPSILRLEQAMHDLPFTVLGVNVGESDPRVRTAAKRLGLDFPILLDRDRRLFKAWDATVLPTSIVIDGRGCARLKAVGPIAWDDNDVIERLRGLAAARPTEAVPEANPNGVRCAPDLRVR